VAEAYGLAFLPFAQEHYDLALVSAHKNKPAVQALLASLASAETQDALVAAGFTPAPSLRIGLRPPRNDELNLPML
jgi:putative molybdopterin biosynthesis protein